MDLQTRIRDLIEDRDTTQKKVAKALGITESTMSGYMTGKVRLPAWLVQMCAEYFQVSSDYLYGLTDDPQHYEGTKREIKHGRSGGTARVFVL